MGVSLSMAIHIGKKIKEELYRQGMPVAVFAKKINRTRNVVYNIFERESIDTELLNKISRVLNCDFFSAFSGQKEYNSEHIKSFIVAENSVAYSKKDEEIALLKQQMEVMKNEIAYLKKIISLMEKKKGR